MRDIDIQLDAALMQLGKGDLEKGRDFVLELANRLERARATHPRWAERSQKNPFYPVEAIRGETNELEYAILNESPERQHDEALDVATTAARFWLGDYKD